MATHYFNHHLLCICPNKRRFVQSEIFGGGPWSFCEKRGLGHKDEQQRTSLQYAKHICISYFKEAHDFERLVFEKLLFKYSWNHSQAISQKVISQKTFAPVKVKRVGSAIVPGHIPTLTSNLLLYPCICYWTPVLDICKPIQFPSIHRSRCKQSSESIVKEKSVVCGVFPFLCDRFIVL